MWIYSLRQSILIHRAGPLGISFFSLYELQLRYQVLLVIESQYDIPCSFVGTEPRNEFLLLDRVQLAVRAQTFE